MSWQKPSGQVYKRKEGVRKELSKENSDVDPGDKMLL